MHFCTALAVQPIVLAGMTKGGKIRKAGGITPPAFLLKKQTPNS
jgi:hypothetical protein